MSGSRGRASGVVRARESRAHGDRRQRVSAGPKPREKATYVASKSDRDWLLNVQRKLYARSWDSCQTCGEPGAYRKVHAGFGGGGSEDRWVKAHYGVRAPIPIPRALGLSARTNDLIARTNKDHE